MTKSPGDSRTARWWGWFQGRMELGPRALGSRSILADPRSPDARRRVNERIKFREGFRPFAPAVLETRSTSFFDLAPPSPYMLFVANVVPSQLVAPTDVRAGSPAPTPRYPPSRPSRTSTARRASRRSTPADTPAFTVSSRRSTA